MLEFCIYSFIYLFIYLFIHNDFFIVEDMFYSMFKCIEGRN